MKNYILLLATLAFGFLVVTPEIAIAGSCDANTPTSTPASGITTTSATISWGKNGGDATNYDYQVATSTGFGTGSIVASGNTTSLSVGLSGLQPNTTYYYRVRSNCPGDIFTDPSTSSYTATQSFTTLTPPSHSTSVSTLPQFTVTYGDGASTSSSVNYTSSNIASSGTVSASTTNNFEVSLSQSSGWGNSVSITKNTTNTPIYIRYNGSDQDAGNKTGTLTFTATGTSPIVINLSAEVTKKQVTLDPSDLFIEKVYDGSTDATGYVSGTYGISGVVAGDELNVLSNGATFTYASKNVGYPITVTGTGFELEGVNGTNADNYDFVDLVSVSDGKISPKSLTIANVDYISATKPYDALNTAVNPLVGAPILNGVVGNDDVALNITGYTFEGSIVPNVGTTDLDVTVNGLVGADMGNYSTAVTEFSVPNGGTITPRELTLVITDPSSITIQKVYDGTDTVDRTTTTSILPTLVNTLPSEHLNVNNDDAIYHFASSEAGDHEVTGTGFELTAVALGDVTDNYTLNDVITIPNGHILQKELTVLNTNGMNAEKVYDGTDTAVNSLVGAPTLDGIVGADDVAFAIHPLGYTFGQVDTGTTDLNVTVDSLTGADKANYTTSVTTFTVDQGGKIHQRPLSLGAGTLAASKIYDGTTDANDPGVVTGDPEFVNLVPADLSDVNLDHTSSLDYQFSSSESGSWTVTGTGFAISGSKSANYSFTDGVSFTGDILVDTLHLDLSGMTFNKLYDGSTDATDSALGTPTILGNPNLVGVQLDYSQAVYTYEQSNVGTNLKVFATGITLGGTNGANYYLAPIDSISTGNINQRPITITADDVEKCYNTADAFVNGPHTDLFTVDNLVQGEEIASVNLSVPSGIGPLTVNNFPITISNAVGAANTDINNYDINYVNGVYHAQPELRGFIQGAANLEICDGQGVSLNYSLYGVGKISGQIQISRLVGNNLIPQDTFNLVNIDAGTNLSVVLPDSLTRNPGGNNFITYRFKFVEVESDRSNCTGVTDGQVDVRVYPVPRISVTMDNEVCSGTPFDIQINNDNNALNAEYVLTANYNGATGGTIAANGEVRPIADNLINETLVNNTDDSIIVTYTFRSRSSNSTHSCQGDSVIKKITIYPVPTLATVMGDTVCEGADNTFQITGLRPNRTFALDAEVLQEYRLTDGTLGSHTINYPGLIHSDNNGAYSFSFPSVASDTIAIAYTLTVNSLTDSLHGCSSDFTNMVAHAFVNPLPDYNFTFNGVSLQAGDTMYVCEGDTVNLGFDITNNVIGNWALTTPYGVDSGVGNTTYSFQAGLGDNGSYGVVVESEFGCTVVDSYYLHVNPLPQYVFNMDGVALSNGDTRELCEGDSVHLDFAVTNGTNVHWVLTTPHGVDSGTGNKDYAFQAGLSDAGDYHLTLTTDSGCVVETSYQMTVHPLPTYNFTFNGVSLQAGDTMYVCEGDTVNLGFDITNNVTGHWTLTTPYGVDTGTNGTTYSFQAGLGDNGSYGVVVESEFGCTVVESYYLHVNPLPQYEFNMDGVALSNGDTREVCEGDSVHLDFAVTNGTNVHWVLTTPHGVDTGDGNTTYAFQAGLSDDGDYHLTLTTDNGCVVETSYQMTVHPLPTYNFTFNGVSLQAGDTMYVCEGDTVNLGFDITNNVTGHWTLTTPYGVDTGTNGTTYSFQAGLGDNGSYGVVVESEFGCTVVDSYYLHVNPLPQYEFNMDGVALSNGDTREVCEGDSVHLDFAVTNGTNVHWVLTTPHGVDTGDGNTTYAFQAGLSDDGDYHLTLTTDNGCVVETSYQMTVHPLPIDTLFINGNPMATNGASIEFCEGATNNFSAGGNSLDSVFVSIGNNLVYSGGINDNGDVTLGLNHDGTYAVTFTSQFGCGVTYNFDMTVHPLPTDAIVAGGISLQNGQSYQFCDGDTVLFTTTGNANDTYTMIGLLGNNFIPSDSVTHGLDSVVMTLNKSGIYYATFTSEFGCTVTDTVTFNVNPLSNATFTVDGVALNEGDTVNVCDGSYFAFATQGSATDSFTVYYNNGTQPVLAGHVGDAGQDVTVAFGSSEGQYTVTFESLHGCLIEHTFNVHVSDIPNVSLVSTTDVGCYGDNSGSIKYNYNGIEQGDYTVEIYNVESDSTFFTHVAPTNQLTATQINVPAGYYSVYVTNPLGCRDSMNVEIHQPAAPLDMNVTWNDLVCGDHFSGVIYWDIDGGTAPYVVHVDGPNTNTNYPANQAANGFHVDGLTAGQYVLNLQDANGCVYNSTVTLEQPTEDPVVATVSVPDSVTLNSNGVMATFEAPGAQAPVTYSYTINGGAVQTVVSDSISGVVNVNVPTNQLGSFVYELVDVQDAQGAICNLTLGNEDNIEVYDAGQPDLVASLSLGTNSMTLNNAVASTSMDILFLNFGSAAYHGPLSLAISIASNSGFSLDFDNNSGWTILNLPGLIIVSKPDVNLDAAGANFIELNAVINVNANIDSGAYPFQVGVGAVPNETNTSNNNTVKILNITR